MTEKVIVLTCPPGIQRDGTNFASDRYGDGQWVRFQRGLPRKIGGYTGIFLNASGISRGVQMTAVNGLNYVVSGYSAGLEQWVTDVDGGVGTGPYTYTLNNFTSSANNLWQFDIGYDSTGGGTNNLVAHPAPNLQDITSTVNTPVLYGAFPGTSGSLSLSKVGLFTATGNVTNTSNVFVLDAVNIRVAAGQTISGTGIPSGTTVSSIDPRILSFTASCAGTALTTVGSPALTVGMIVTIAGGTSLGAVVSGSVNSWVVSIGGVYASQTMAASTNGIVLVTMSAAATTTAAITATFDNNIAVSGGCVMIHPYLFIYGNNGLIQNCSAGDFANWVSPDANANNMATGKIVKGLPLRGGSTSPSGLFWSTDSLIRVSFSPSSSGGQNYYWTYDIITSQTSIMSSQSVIEYDGVYYWAGVDRFLKYNGVVSEIPNTVNQNWFFDNLNYFQRQKVWVTKVPRYGEIWWFYPRGSATECTDAIIYNVREDTWYDAGLAVGAQRSAGAFSEIFPKPLWAGNVANTEGKYTLWQHETGMDQVYLTSVNAIRSYYETSNLGTLYGLVGAAQSPGANLWTRLDRIEPDFIQQGDMSVVVTGASYADGPDQVSAPYVYSPTTYKIDMREQRRELRLRFESNTFNGDYQAGKILLGMTTGDVRGTGNP